MVVSGSGLYMLALLANEAFQALYLSVNHGENWTSVDVDLDCYSLPRINYIGDYMSLVNYCNSSHHLVSTDFGATFATHPMSGVVNDDDDLYLSGYAIAPKNPMYQIMWLEAGLVYVSATYGRFWNRPYIAGGGEYHYFYSLASGADGTNLLTFDIPTNTLFTTNADSVNGTALPTSPPTLQPTAEATTQTPTASPTMLPTFAPTMLPTPRTGFIGFDYSRRAALTKAEAECMAGNDAVFFLTRGHMTIDYARICVWRHRRTWC